MDINENKKEKENCLFLEELITKNFDIINVDGNFCDKINWEQIDNSIFKEFSYHLKKIGKFDLPKANNEPGLIYVDYFFVKDYYLDILQKIKLSQEFISEFNNSFYYWKTISRNPSLDEEMIRKNDNCIIFDNLSTRVLSRLSYNFFEDYKNYLHWDYISNTENFELSEEFIDLFKENLNWTCISERSDLMKKSDYFFEKYKFYLDWDSISLRKDLKEEFLDKWGGYNNVYNFLNWSNICQNLDFNERMFEKYKNFVNWKELDKRYLLNFSLKKREEIGLPLIPYPKMNNNLKPTTILSKFK